VALAAGEPDQPVTPFFPSMRILPNRWARWVSVIVFALGIVGVGGYLFFEPGWRYVVHGVDVSHHQGDIDWTDLADDRTDFAYIKATEGADWIDPLFEANWRSAGQAGVLRGAYHFFTLCTPGGQQALNMIDVVPDATDMLPPAVDLEFGGNCSERPSVDDFRGELDSFLGAIERHYRMRPVIYTNAQFYDTYLRDEPPDVIWWIMSPVLEPWGSPEWTLWQSFPGHRKGVEGRVDRNVFRGDLGELEALARRKSR
jgi:lysozyme